VNHRILHKKKSSLVKKGMQISLCIVCSKTFIAIEDEYEAKSYIMFTGKNKWDTREIIYAH